ncbi:MAG TPA: DUF503 domain-containing protein [Polyangiaceae bacterium]|jgi:hypothetical protein|nr:DUF503 domain-containing protein [Polyangiaceae bacterium]
MFVGVARFVLQMPGARSLKDRRSVVRSFKDRVRARLKASVAEVGDVEAWQIATVSIAVVSRERPRCDEALSAATSIAGSLSEAILADVRTEVLSFGKGGERIRGGIEHSLDEEHDS